MTGKRDIEDIGDLGDIKDKFSFLSFVLYVLYVLYVPLSPLSAESWTSTDLPPPFEIRLAFDKKTLELDEEFHLQLHARYPSSHQLDGSVLISRLVWAGNPFSPQVALGDVQANSSSEKDIQTLDLKAILYPMKEGELKLTFSTILFEPLKDSEKPVRVQTPIFPIHVLPSALTPSSLQFAPLAPLDIQFPLGLTEKNRRLFIDGPMQMEQQKAYNQSLWRKSQLPWLVLLFFLCLAGIGGMVYWQRKRLFPPRPLQPWNPKEAANAALRAVEERKESSQAIKTYYSELVNILRRILQDSWGISVRGKTAVELSRSVASLSLPSEMKEKIFTFLNEVDLMKFAGEHPPALHIQANYDQLLEMIDQLTSPIYLRY